MRSPLRWPVFPGPADPMAQGFPKERGNLRWEGSVCLLAAIVLLAYTAARAAILSFTHDEAWAYMLFLHLPWREAFYSGKGVSSANHFLNTALQKIIVPCLGSREIALRLPSLCGHVIYLAATYRLATRYRPGALVLCSFVLLNANPFQLDFFSLARGYGLGLAFMALSLVFLDAALRPGENRLRSEAGALGFASISALSNFSFLLFFNSVAALLLLRNWRRPRRFFALSLASLAGEAILLPPLMKIRSVGDLYFGGTSGFWSDTVGSLVDSTLYDLPLSAGAIIAIEIFVLLGLLGGFASLVVAFRPPSSGRLRKMMGPLLLGGCVLESVAAHRVLGVNFLIERTALSFLPLFALVVMDGLQLLADQASALGHVAGRGTAILLVAICLLNAGVAANLTHTLSWSYMAEEKQFMEDLDARHRTAGSKASRTLAVTWWLRPTAEYYREILGLRWLSDIGRMDDEVLADYYYVSPSQGRLLTKRRATILKRYGFTGNYFAEAP